jgi:hypothetical protein
VSQQTVTEQGALVATTGELYGVAPLCSRESCHDTVCDAWLAPLWIRSAPRQQRCAGRWHGCDRRLKGSASSPRQDAATNKLHVFSEHDGHG